MPDDGVSDRPLLALKGLAKRFGGITALDGVDFRLGAGEIHGLLGWVATSRTISPVRPGSRGRRASRFAGSAILGSMT